jgi:hypothetical protein
MPPTHRQARLQTRSHDADRNFSIIFAVVAFVIISVCLFWGFFLPKYRKKHPPKPVQTRYNHPPPSQVFPSHPAVRTDISVQSSGRLRKYNPRTQTPFPMTPPRGDSLSLPSLPPHENFALNSSQIAHIGEFSFPATDRLPSRRGLPQASVRSESSTHGSRPESVNQEHFSLQVPEPLVLHPRSAGKAPSLSRHLAQFPMPRSGSAESSKLVHPRKLFQDLENRYSKSTTVTSIGTPCPIPLNTRQQVDLLREGGQDDGTQEFVFDSTPKAPSRTRENSLEVEEITQSSLTHVRANKVTNIGRSGTVTRPKTPVAEIRNLYDEKASFTVSIPPESSKSTTASSFGQPADSSFSTCFHSDTPFTSPLQQPVSSNPPGCFISEEKDRQQDLLTPKPLGADSVGTPGSMIPEENRAAAMRTTLESVTGEKRPGKFLRQIKFSKRPKLARLNLSFSALSPSFKRKAQRHSISSLGSLLMPLGKAKRPSVRVSSVYSRDTRDVSFVQSPTSFSTTEKFSPGPLTESFPTGPIPRKASSLDLVRSKIDNWDLHTTYLDFSSSPSSELKRALSDLGPRSPSFPALTLHSVVDSSGDSSERNVVQHPVPKIFVARPSDDIFRDPSPKLESGRVLRRVLDMEVAASMATLKRYPSQGSAPGGADWI